MTSQEERESRISFFYWGYSDNYGNIEDPNHMIYEGDC